MAKFKRVITSYKADTEFARFQSFLRKRQKGAVPHKIDHEENLVEVETDDAEIIAFVQSLGLKESN